MATDSIGIQTAKKGKLFPLIFVLLGLIAFASGAYSIVRGKAQHQQFHEVKWDARNVLNTIVDSALQDTGAVIAFVNEKQRLHLLPTESGKLTTAKDSLLKMQRYALLKIRERIGGMNNAEVQQYAVKSLRIESLDISDFKRITDTLSMKKYRQSVPVFFYDSSLIVKPIKRQVVVSTVAYDFNDFVTQYPYFGYWAISLLIQTTLYLLLIPYLLFRVFSAKSKKVLATKWKIIYVLIIAAVCVAFYFGFLEAPGDANNGSRGGLFMHNLYFVFGMVNTLGYITAAICLAGLLFVFIDAGYFTPVGNMDDRKATYLQALNNEFKTYFTLTAVILTFGVITTGQFYSGLNSLSLIKAYNASVGYDYFRIEVVYLYGILHTFLLFLFYIPVQQRLKTLNAFLPASQKVDDHSTAAATGKGSGTSGFMKNVTDLLVVSSPLLAAFVKSLIDMIFG